MSKYALTGFTRIFLIAGRARPDHAPTYQSCLKAGGVTKGFGDVTKIECPDPNQYGKYVQVGEIRGAEERATTTLTGRYAADVKSDLMELARKKCAVDMQVHFGACSDPSQFNTFTKALVLESAFLTNFGTGDLGALASDEQASIDQTADLSAANVYEVLPLSAAAVGSAQATLEVVDVVFAGSPSCGECIDENSGCDKIYAVRKGAAGSPETKPAVLYSVNGGSSWSVSEIDKATATNVPTGIAILGSYVVVTFTTTPFVAYCPIADLAATTPWTVPADVSAYGLSANHAPTAISSTGTYAFITSKAHAGSTTAGFIYGMSDPTEGVTVLESGALGITGGSTYNDLNAVSAFSNDIAIAVGANGVVLYTNNGGSLWAAATTPAAEALTAAFAKNNKEWLVGGVGKVYYTNDAGTTWGTKSNFSGSGSGVVKAISFATDSLGYMAHNTGSAGRLYRTFDGGYSWVRMPDGVGAWPTCGQIDAVAACKFDPNVVIAVGINATTVGTMIMAQ